MDRSKSLAKSWDDNAGNWTKAVREGQIPSRRAGTDDAIVAAILDREPARLLDVGCGEGWLVRRIVRASGCRAVGIDGSAALIEAARSADPTGDYRVLSYADLVGGTSSLGDRFDVIAFNYAILNEDAAQLLTAVTPALARDGCIIIQTLHPQTQDGPYRDGWRTEDFSGFAIPGWKPMPWYFRTLESWHAVIRDAGLVLCDLAEPTAEGDDRPLSLILTCMTAEHGPMDPV